ncbi:MAG: hypothetical protein PF482_19025 [Desulfobacteraceae bacterium]|jgi:hypothetical protein|nr:hypothetical protein [Desulfobacteraceae bacterium]
MNQRINDKISILRQSLQAAGIKVSERENGIRLKLHNGYHVDIFTLSNNPDSLRARLETDEPDPLRRQAYVESTQNSIIDSLAGIASVEPFKFSREAGGSFIYNSVLIMDEIFDDNVPIEISEDAIEIIDEVEPVSIDMAGDDLAEFELDFAFGEENRLKVVKSLAEEAIENLEIVDAKTLRQSLDMMSLKRSSGVRLALTRIFRSATEVEELETAIQEEAQKIVSPQDRAELQEVKSLCANGFLDPVVDLLWQEVFQDPF